MKAGLAFLALCATAAPLSAATYIYQLDGIVTDVYNVPNSFPEGPQWDFTNNPLTFSGTFEADSKWAGPISNFQLEIGGVDLPAFHPENTFPIAGGGTAELNIFDPTTNILRWAGIDNNLNTTFVSIGDTLPNINPNRIVAIQFTDPQLLPPGDPDYLTTMNWEGTYGVKKKAKVPESGATLAIASLGLGGVLLLNGLAGRRKRV